jgi:hypothetical protein
MAQQFSGTVEILDNNSNIIITLDGTKGDITLGDHGQDGNLNLKNKEGKSTVFLRGGSGIIEQGGSLVLSNKDGKPTMSFYAETGIVSFGDNGENGLLRLRDKDGKIRISLAAESAEIILGGNGQRGGLALKNEDGKKHYFIGRKFRQNHFGRYRAGRRF